MHVLLLAVFYHKAVAQQCTTRIFDWTTYFSKVCTVERYCLLMTFMNWYVNKIIFQWTHATIIHE